ncbi:hypothetical protein DW228_18330 [Bacteroides fragilis]|mgnify:CR=1 FL=1|uniref:DOD-type homing endonuclease domain-containing protein n=1 Tax=Bacteroides fragilis TaxID=817 RepID=A0A396BX30_BACFG|nr:phage terminase large subunit [Bacteroides fragilis]RHH07891.1 hypothetical protein DW228_18330 [Bacteroides fragilis]
MAGARLKAPKNLKIDFSPSPKQYELWRLLQPECHVCGGEIQQKLIGYDANMNPQYKPYCTKCGNQNVAQLILGGGAAGGGKMGLLDSTVCTPFGFRKVCDLKVGDIITSAISGGQQRIIQLHPIAEMDFYRVHFIDGTHFDCSEGHLWQLHQSRKRTKKKNTDGSPFNERIWETRKMYEWMQNKKAGMYKGCNLIIPLCAPVQFTMTKLINRPKPITPYILGALLGDGCMTQSICLSGTIGLTTMDEEIVEQFRRAGYDMSHSYQSGTNRAKFYKIRDYHLMEGLARIKLIGQESSTKLIPLQYKYATIEERKELIRGLMDTDGYVDARGHMSYSTVSKQLAEDVAFVIRSLGGKATIKKNKAGYRDGNGTFNQCRDVYDVYFVTKCDPELVSISRKKKRCKPHFNGGNSELGKRITDIEFIGKREGRCITVDEPCGLYVADDFTVTHNSYLASVWLVSSCIRFPDIRAVVARKTLKSLKESTWNTIRMIIKNWGLVEDEHYHINNVAGTLRFWNGSVILMLDLADQPSDPNFERFGSMEATICAVDEVSEISSKAIEVLFSRLRWKTHETFKVSKMLMTTNPTTNWIRDRFVQDGNGDKVQTREGEYYIPFSVFDNPDIAFRQTYEAALNKISDQATKERLLYGNWDFVVTNDMAIYRQFNGAVHLVTGLKESVYDPTKPLITIWDFNVAPYMSTLLAQIDYDRKKVYILEEILGKAENKENNTPALARKIQQKLYREKHIGGIDVTGDPAGLQRSTAAEDGVNNFTIISTTFGKGILRPKVKLLKKQPPQATRCEFVNEVFNAYGGWEIRIDIRCRKLTEDLIYQLKNEDGTKSKAKTRDPRTNVKYEKYGHLSDCLDYLLCYYLRDAWHKFKNGGDGGTLCSTPAQYDGFNY